jgi:NADPH:quinone reductase-like Zn-dependent oxidoreductase
MHAAVLREFGSIPEFAEFPDPEPTGDEVLVKVTAAAVSPVAVGIVEGQVLAGALKPPLVPGVEGVGTLPDGRRVSFAIRRPPYGSMAERTVALPSKSFQLPDDIDDVTAAGLFHPGLASWLALSARAQLVPGESVLVLGATGSAGRAAVQIARLLGAGRVVAAGRDSAALAELQADAVIDLSLPDDELAAAYADAAPYDVIVDYLWGKPTEFLLRNMPRHLFPTSALRYVPLGNRAGNEATLDIRLLLRAGATLLTSSVNPPEEVIIDSHRRLMAHAAKGEIRLDFAAAKLSDVGTAWPREARTAKRLVLTP